MSATTAGAGAKPAGNVKKRFIGLFCNYGLYIIFLLVIVSFASRSAQFLTVKNAITIVQLASALGIATVGMFFVLITGGIDISVASNMYFSALMGSYLLNRFNVPILVSFVVAVLCGAFIGTINGIFVARFKMVPFITTLATMSIARGFGLIISDQKMVILNEQGFKVANTRLFGVPVMAFVFLITVAIGHFVFTRTQFGRQLFACGNNLTGANRIGINGPRTVFIAYLVCGCLAGLAGMVNACNLTSITQNFAIGDEFVVISSAVVGGASLFGGKGKVFPGALIGIIMIQVIINGLTITNASPYAYTVVRGVIIFIAVMVDSIKFSGEIR